MHKMEDSYIIANFHALCRLCLKKSTRAVSIFGAVPDDEANSSLTSKIAECFDLQIDPNDGLPGRICYKCLFKVNICSKFKLQCIQSENRLRQITNRINELENSNSSEINNYNYSNSQESLKPKPEDYNVGDSVMVVGPSHDNDSSEVSDNVDTVEHDVAESDNTPNRDTTQESFIKNVFMCQYCDQAFVSQEKCTEHEQSFHDASRPYECIECSLVFAERSQIVQHTRQMHGDDKPYHCPECEQCFGIRSDLRKHSIVHTGIRPYQCQHCLKNFSRNTNLTKHLRIHAGHKPHVCHLCPRSFVAKGDLQRHVLVHSGMKPYACKRCPSTFSRRYKLIEHEVRHRPMSLEHKGDDFDKNQESYDMVVSVNAFSNLNSSPTEMHGDTSNAHYDLPRIPNHISGESSSMKVKKTPTSSIQLQNSPTKKAVCNKNRPKNIQCHQCPKKFCSLDAYNTHVSIAHKLDHHATVHSSMKAFACNQCGKKFTRKDKLDKHEQTHECLVVSMPCIEHGATFEKKADLVAHIKSHFSDNYDDKIPESEIKKEEPEYPVDEHLYDMET